MQIEVLPDDYKVAICRSIYDVNPVILSSSPYLIEELEFGGLNKDTEWVSSMEGQKLIYDHMRSRELNLTVSIKTPTYEETAEAFASLINAIESPDAFLETKWKGQYEHLWWKIQGVSDVSSEEFNEWLWRRKTSGIMPSIKINLFVSPYGLGEGKLLDVFTSWIPRKIVSDEWIATGNVTITEDTGATTIIMPAGSKITEKAFHKIKGGSVSILARTAENTIPGLKIAFLEYDSTMNQIGEKVFDFNESSGDIVQYSEVEWGNNTVYVKRELRNTSSSSRTFDVVKWVVVDDFYLVEPAKSLGMVNFSLPEMVSDGQVCYNLDLNSHDLWAEEGVGAPQQFHIGIGRASNQLIYDWDGENYDTRYYGQAALQVTAVQNLLTNPSFETGDTQGWTVSQQGTNPHVSVTNTRSRHGTHSLKMGCGSGSGYCDVSVTSTPITVDETAYYLCNVWTSGYCVEDKKSRIVGRHYLSLYKGNKYVRQIEVARIQGGRAEWTRRTIFVSPEDLKGITSFRVRYQVYSATTKSYSNCFYYFDAGEVFKIDPEEFPTAEFEVEEGFYIPDFCAKISGGIDIDVILFINAAGYQNYSLILDRIAINSTEEYTSQIFTNPQSLYLKKGKVKITCALIANVQYPQQVYFDRLALIPCENSLTIRSLDRIKRVETTPFSSSLISDTEVHYRGNPTLSLDAVGGSGIAYWTDENASTHFLSGDIKLIARPIHFFVGGK